MKTSLMLLLLLILNYKKNRHKMESNENQPHKKNIFYFVFHKLTLIISYFESFFDKFLHQSPHLETSVEPVKHPITFRITALASIAFTMTPIHVSIKKRSLGSLWQISI